MLYFRQIADWLDRNAKKLADGSYTHSYVHPRDPYKNWPPDHQLVADFDDLSREMAQLDMEPTTSWRIFVCPKGNRTRKCKVLGKRRFIHIEHIFSWLDAKISFLR